MKRRLFALMMCLALVLALGVSCGSNEPAETSKVEWLMHDDYPVQVGDPASDDCVHTTVGELETGKALEQ